jgi:hypothetical protein
VHGNVADGRVQLCGGVTPGDDANAISVKDYSRNKNFKVLPIHVPFAPRRFLIRMNGQPRIGIRIPSCE